MNGRNRTSPRAKFVIGFSFLASAAILGSGAASASPIIQSLRGANQETTYGAVFPAPLVVWVTDSVTERAVSGVKVHYMAGTGIGLTAADAITDEYGLASVTASGLSVCASEVRAEIAGNPDASVRFDGLVVNKATLTVVPADLVLRLGSPIPALTSYTIQGFVNGDTLETAQITGAPILTTTAKDHSPHANYAIKGGAGTLFSPNYTFVPGFGTIAVLDEPNAGGSTNYVYQSEAYFLPSAKEEEARVQAAIADEPVLIGITQPSFLAGLHGESGAFVRAAIWQNPAATSADISSRFIRAAIGAQPVAAAGHKQGSETAVLAAALPASATAAQAARSLHAKTAISMATVADAQRGTGENAPVHTAVSPKLSTVFAITPASGSQPVIRQAFHPQPVYR